jgi:hypothetical protein
MRAASHGPAPMHSFICSTNASWVSIPNSCLMDKPQPSR